MRRPTRTATAVVALGTSLGLLTGCGSGDDYELASADVQRAVETEVAAGSVEVVLPAGAATGGKLAVQEGPEPANVPEGVLALGSSAMVSLFEGSLEGTMEVSFEPPAELTAEHVPVVMAKDSEGEWQWRPTSWDGGQSRVTAELTSPGHVFLARFDRAPWLEELGAQLEAKRNDPRKVQPPTCGDEDSLVDEGLQVSSEPDEVLLWCAGVDTIRSTAAVSGFDVDYATEGVQAPVLRLSNHTRMFQEVGYPDGWLEVDGSRRGALAGQTLRERLGLAGTTRVGLGTRVVEPGGTLTLLLPAAPAGTVTADLSAAAWTLSAIDFALSSYVELVSGVDERLGDEVRAARKGLLAQLAAPPDEKQEVADPAWDLAAVAECLAPVSDVILMNPDTAQQLVGRVFTCAPSLLRPALADGYAGGATAMADGVATSVLTGLPTTVEMNTDSWGQLSDAMTDARAGFQVWVGEPPAEEYDYSDSPHVFRPQDDVAVAEWSTEFTAYLEERLATVDETAEPESSGAGGCPEALISVSRYRTDGYALVTEVGCDAEEWRLVLGRTDGGWQELDDIQQDPLFGCDVMGMYDVPAFIAGDTCLDGEQTQEYTG